MLCSLFEARHRLCGQGQVVHSRSVGRWQASQIVLSAPVNTGRTLVAKRRELPQKRPEQPEEQEEEAPLPPAGDVHAEASGKEEEELDGYEPSEPAPEQPEPKADQPKQGPEQGPQEEPEDDTKALKESLRRFLRQLAI